MKTCASVCIAFAAALFLPTRAETIRAASNDGRWLVDITAATAPRVGEPFELTAEVSPNSPSKACPALRQVIFDMPQHGHGSDYDNTIETLPLCSWRVSGVTPTMIGIWRMRLVLGHGPVVTLAEVLIQVE